MSRVNNKAAFALFVAGLLTGATGCASHVVKSESPSASSPSSAERIATLRHALDNSGKTIAELRAEIAQLRIREEELTNSLKEAIRERTGQPPLPSSAKMLPVTNSAEVAAMKKDLEHERQRRKDLEEQLARLKSETATPAFVDTSAQAREIAELRNALTNEREAHKRLLNEVMALREKNKQILQMKAAKGGGSAESSALRARLITLEKRHQEVMTSMARTVAADRKREEDLMAQLAKLREQAAAAQVGAVQTAQSTVSGGNTSAVEEENAKLRSLLEEERHRNARLAAKLKLAGRVTDLIFKMQNQPAEQAPPAAPPPP